MTHHRWLHDDGNNSYILVMQSWQSHAWPNFTHDPAKTKGFLTLLAGRLGAVEGLQAGLTPAERHETFLRAATSEALASFAIEGAALPADQIAATVMALLAHRHSEPRI